ncbi:MAG TPA: sigma 54-interacting transcriptional regulator [Patescibacteria group bacterium]|nr:sigma 54-interacting transcriptional regulator [Patescibacteria group bacterium]
MKITLIAPMDNMMDTAREVLDKQNFGWSGEIEIVSGLLDTGVEQARKAVANGTDIIISRGGTASLIAKSIDIPVVEVQVTAFDVLRALKSVGEISGTVGVIFIRRFLFECEKLGALIGIPIREIFLENERVPEEVIEKARQEGITTFLGDASSVKILLERGLVVGLIESSAEAISKAFLEAINLAGVRRQEREKTELFRTIINASTDGIIAIDKNEKVTVFNPALERLYQLDSDAVVGRPIGEVIPGGRLLTNAYEGESVKNINGRAVAIKKIPIRLGNDVVGVIANVQDVTQLQYFEQVVRQKLNKKGLRAKFHLEQLSAVSPPMQVIKEQIRQYAGNDATVLITGESGTGKERVAQSIHNLSRRKDGPFVAVNCAALPESLLESELFGYEEGAFTGAKKGGKSGLFELAHGGTIFLDEIGEMPLALQARLLRVLQEKEVMRLGANSVIPVNVRILSATNQDIMQLVDEKKFRIDLYYRLDVLRLHIPPLRERLADIPDLVRNFLAKENNKVFQITEQAMALLQQQYWRGNIRELENVIERVKLLAERPVIEERMLRQALTNCVETGNETMTLQKESNISPNIQKLLLEEKYNYTRTAKRLGISRTTLWRKLRELGKH